MAPRITLLLGLLVVAAVVAITLAPSEARRSGTNNVPVSGPVAALAPGAEVCQPEDVPEQTRVVRLHVAAGTGAPARPVVRIVGAGGAARSRGRPREVASGVFDVALSSTAPAGPADVCVRNGGTRLLEVFGYPAGERREGRTGPIAFDYYRPGRESWLQVAGVVGDRVSFGKSGLLGGAALWLAVALVLTAWAFAFTALWRIGGSE